MPDIKISEATGTTPTGTDMFPFERVADATARMTTFTDAFSAMTANTTTKGAVELATVAEAQAGLSSTLVTTPESIKEYFNQTVPIENAGAFQWEQTMAGLAMGIRENISLPVNASGQAAMATAAATSYSYQTNITIPATINTPLDQYALAQIIADEIRDGQL